MLLCYENALGTVCFGGGGGLWNITDYSGLGLADKSFLTVSYAGSDGQITLSERAEGRLISIKGDCRLDREALRESLRILNQKGRLSVMEEEHIRCISVYCSHVELTKRKGDFREFLIQFTADDPYFEGEHPVEMALYSREDLISGHFLLPCLFTERVMTSTVLNQGDVAAEPILTIFCKEAGQTEENGDLLIENKTTGFTFRLQYTMQKDEVITVNVPTRQVTSTLKTEENHDGNLIYCLSHDTVLSNFKLMPGENQFEATNFDTGSDIVVRCALTEKYLEAML